VVLFLLLFSWLTHRLRKDFNMFTSFFSKAAHFDEEINRDLIQFVELDLMAKDANKMLRDRIHAHRDILDEKEKLFITLKSIGDGVITTDLSSRIELMNVVAEKLTGWRFDEAQGKQLSDIFTIVNAKTKEETENPVERVLENGKIVGLANDTMLISRNGTEYQIYDSAAPIKDVSGRTTGVVFVFRDVTKKYKMLEDLRQSEAKSSALLAAIPDFIFVQNRDGVFLNCYSTNSDNFFVPVERALGKRIQDIFSKEIASELIAVFEQALATRRIQVYDYQLPIAGQRRFFEIRIVLYGDDKVLSIVRDITERRQAEEELQRMEKLKSIGTLAGGIAHDFNNILTGIYGNISMAKEKIPADIPGVEFLNEAANSMARATRLTKQLLTFSKGGEPVKEDVNIGVLVEEVVRFDLSGSNVKPVFDRARDLWMAEVDKSQIQQVFSNLIINADQAMPDGGHLFVTLENADISKGAVLGLDQGKYVRITVKDEGIGIDQKHFEMIFDPYYTTKKAGSGLGLATVYSVIKKHGGHISVGSEIGKGTIFTLYLPALESRQQPVKHIYPEAESPASKKTGRVLVMDDEEMIHKLVTRMLERSRFSVETAYDGRQAIEMYNQALGAGNPFDVVIMDITVPGGMGGKEAVREILEINPEARVIVSSGYANNPVMANYAEYGFKGIVAKPYTRSKMLAVLNQVLWE
jgi:PAS domain S-box-containing protein